MPESIETLRAELEGRIRFETFLAEISARFVHLSPERIESEIVDAQRRLREFLSLDRSAFYLDSDLEPGTLCLKHLNQTRDGQPPLGLRVENLFPWTAKRIKAGEIVAIRSMRERARLIRGELAIRSQPEKGTVITLKVPLAEEGES